MDKNKEKEQNGFSCYYGNNINKISKNRNAGVKLNKKENFNFEFFKTHLIKFLSNMFKEFIINYSKKKERKLINVLLLIILCFYFYFIFLLYKYAASLNDETYDLMKDALSRQNVTRFQVKCSEVDEIKDDSYIDEYTGDIDAKYVTEKLKLFKNYFLRVNYNYYSHYNSFEIKQPNETLIKYKLIDSFIRKIKLCAINWNMQIISKKFNDSYLAYLFKDDLNYTFFRKDDVNIQKLNLGGYHKPNYCLQDFFYFLSKYKSDELNEIYEINKIGSNLYFNKSNNKSNEINYESDSEQARENEIKKINEYGQIGLKFIKKSNIKLKKTQNIREFIDEVSKSSLSILNNLYKFSLNQSKKNSMELIINSYLQEKEKFTAIIIPFLNREKNLIELLLNLHAFLQRQYVHYRIFVAEQFNSQDPFNKGRLYNMAFKFIKTKYKDQVNCFILHDVDLIPESDYNLYECDHYFNVPRHLSFSIRTENSNTSMKSYVNSPYELLVGGVLCIKPNIYEKINGFSNEYWSWGAEDDDLAMRMIAEDVCIKRPGSFYSIYKMSSHVPSTRNPIRNNLLFSSVKRMSVDGLSNISGLNVTVKFLKNYPFFTHINIDVGMRSKNYFKYLVKKKSRDNQYF